MWVYGRNTETKQLWLILHHLQNFKHINYSVHENTSSNKKTERVNTKYRKLSKGKIEFTVPTNDFKLPYSVGATVYSAVSGYIIIIQVNEQIINIGMIKNNGDKTGMDCTQWIATDHRLTRRASEDQ